MAYQTDHMDFEGETTIEKIFDTLFFCTSKVLFLFPISGILNIHHKGHFTNTKRFDATKNFPKIKIYVNFGHNLFELSFAVRNVRALSQLKLEKKWKEKWFGGGGGKEFGCTSFAKIDQKKNDEKTHKNQKNLGTLKINQICLILKIQKFKGCAKKRITCYVLSEVKRRICGRKF